MYEDEGEGEEERGFIGRTKRTIWMGSPSLHPTYSNFYTFSSITDSRCADHYLHLEYIRTFIQLLNDTYFVHLLITQKIMVEDEQTAFYKKSVLTGSGLSQAKRYSSLSVLEL